ncbi:hypothetical protein BH18GEM1_BH18GEM1_21440 [soil metagenome]
MRIPRPTVTIAAALLIGSGASGAAAQDIDLSDVLSNDAFYAESGIFRARGDVPFVADFWALPGTADSVGVLIGVSLSNQALQFVRTSEGQWQASYEVVAVFEPQDDGRAPIEKRWEKSVEVGSFDETLLTGETIVFQTQMGLVPGDYELALTVRDQNAEEDSRVTADLELPDFSAREAAVAEPVLLRVYEPGASGTEYVVNPSHYYESAPPDFDFMVEVIGASTAAPYVLTARLVPTEDTEEVAGRGAQETAAVWTDTVTMAENGPARVFGSLGSAGARFGEYGLALDLADGSGRVVATAKTPLLIAGSGGWIAENWKEDQGALSLIRYEATKDELEILEDIEGDEQRIAAWNCFWQIRDPVPTTSANEAMSDYFTRIQIANNEFKSALRPGYLSDRGRVFITLGRPDEVTQRPVPSGSEAYEVWTYHRHNFQILFVDRIGFNNYQIENVGTYQRELAAIDRRKLSFLKESASQCPLLAPAFE